MRDLKDVVEEVVENCGICLEHTSDRFKDDEKIVFAAVEDDVDAFQFASERLRSDRDFVLRVLTEKRRTVKGYFYRYYDDYDGRFPQNPYHFAKAMAYVSEALLDDADLCDV